MKKKIIFFVLFLSLVFGAVCVYGQAAQAAYDRGLAALKQENYDKAITEFTEAIRLDPNNVDAYLLRGASYYAKGDKDRALADANTALRIEPSNESAKALLAKLK